MVRGGRWLARRARASGDRVMRRIQKVVVIVSKAAMRRGGDGGIKGWSILLT